MGSAQEDLVKFKVLVVGEAHADQLSYLRKTAYSESHSGVDVSEVGWSPWDRIHFNLGITFGGELISSMRIAISSDVQDFKICFLHELGSGISMAPFAMIHRLATKAEFRGQGLSSLLRYHAIRTTRALGCHYVFGGYWAGTRQDKYFEQMGYSVQDIGQDRLTESGPGTALTFVALNLYANYSRATAFLEELLGDKVKIASDIDVEALRSKYGP